MERFLHGRVYGVTLSGKAFNVSINGIYVVADYEVQKGAVLELAFVLPDEKGSQIHTKGKVAWMNNMKESRKQGLPAGFGIEFNSITEEYRAALERYIGSR